MLFNITAFAKTPEENEIDTLEKAKEYLLTYRKVETNKNGKEFITTYQFAEGENLDAAAEFIVENGLDTFNSELEKAIQEYVKNEDTPSIIIPRSTTPGTGHATVSGNGNHNVSAQASGLAQFPSIGNLEYRVVLGYRVTVQNSTITSISNISFDIPYIQPNGSWGNLRLPSNVSGKYASVTANYNITKTINVSVGDFGVPIKSETTNEIFALLTNLQ